MSLVGSGMANLFLQCPAGLAEKFNFRTPCSNLCGLKIQGKFTTFNALQMKCYKYGSSVCFKYRLLYHDWYFNASLHRKTAWWDTFQRLPVLMSLTSFSFFKYTTSVLNNVRGIGLHFFMSLVFLYKPVPGKKLPTFTMNRLPRLIRCMFFKYVQ